MREGTHERRATSARHRADLEFRRLLDALPTAAYTCDAEGLITYFNQRAAEAWGREPLLDDPRDRF
jgi:PAS domain-containing protein